VRARAPQGPGPRPRPAVRLHGPARHRAPDACGFLAVGSVRFWCVFPLMPLAFAPSPWSVGQARRVPGAYVVERATTRRMEGWWCRKPAKEGREEPPQPGFPRHRRSTRGRERVAFGAWYLRKLFSRQLIQSALIAVNLFVRVARDIEATGVFPPRDTLCCILAGTGRRNTKKTKSSRGETPTARYRWNSPLGKRSDELFWRTRYWVVWAAGDTESRSGSVSGASLLFVPVPVGGEGLRRRQLCQRAWRGGC